MKSLSKSKLIAFRQCPRRVWLEVHHPELRSDSTGAKARFQVGYQVGELARKLYDPGGKGLMIDAQTGGYKAALARSTQAMMQGQTVFEAGFAAEGAIAFADIMLPDKRRGSRAGQGAWRMIEVKSATSVAEYHQADAAIQAFVARRAGVNLTSVAVATIDSSWVYGGDGNYQGILVEHDQTEQAFARDDEVRGWIADAQAVVAKRREPQVSTGARCKDPFECGFFAYCQGLEPQAEYPVQWLPQRTTKALKAHLADTDARDMRDVPDELLNETQLRIKKATLSGRRLFDKAGARAAMAAHKLPAYFLDFETIAMAVPIWKGMRPYQQVPFQFSCHRLSRTGKLDHTEFLDLSGKDPSQAIAQALIDACGQSGPVFVFNQSFEATRLRELAQRFRRLAPALTAIVDRLVDLLPVARQFYYHPSQQGSWSIKKLLPAMVPKLRYDQLDSVQDGGAAVQVYLEAIAPGTPADRKRAIEQQLLAYCRLDTQAMVEVRAVLAGER